MTIGGRRPRRTALVHLAAAVALAAAGAAAAADRVFLRGGAEVEGTVTEISPGGLSMRRTTPRAGGTLEAVDRWTWDQVRAVEAPADLAGAASLPSLLKEGERLWRARLRLERGDPRGAAEALAAPRAAEVDGATAVVAALAELQVAISSRDGAAATRAAFECLRRTGGGAPAGPLATAQVLTRDGRQVAIPLFDVATGLPPLVPPFALAEAERPAVLQALDAAVAAGGPAGSWAALYAACVDPARPLPPPAPLPGGEPAARVGDFLRAAHDAMSTDPAQRAKAREAIQQLRRRLPAWAEAWARVALGRSLLAETDPVERARGQLQLLHAVARHGAEQPALAAAAARVAAEASTAAGRTEEAAVLASALLTARDPVAPAAGTTSAVAAREADDDLSEWLQRPGLERFLALLLQERMARAATPAEKRDLAERLAELVSRQLEGAPSAAELEALAAVAQEVTPQLPQVEADALGLALLRARYRPLARGAEEFRMARASLDEATAFRDGLRTLAPAFEALRKRLDAELKTDDRKLDRSVGLDAETLLDAVDRKRALLDTSRFLQAWTLYYLGWIERRLTPAKADAARRRIEEAEALFTALLDTGQADPAATDVSVDRRGEETYASAVLGTALCRSWLRGPGRAGEWFDLLADARTAAAVRRNAGAWRLAALLDAGDWEAAKTLISDAARRGEVPVSWLRLAAAESLASAAPGAAEAAQSAVALLAGQGELGEVLDLATRFPGGKLPQEGFVGRYVAGVRLYEEARAARDKGETSAVPFRGAAEALLAAVAQPDAQRFPQAQAGARQLAAWSLVGCEEFARAAAAFEAAADGLPPAKAAESLWLAAGCAARAAAGAAASERAGFQAARARCVERLVSQYPESEFAARAAVVKIQAQESAGDAELRQLLAVPRASPAWAEARAQAAEILYRMFRAAPEAERPQAAARFLELAVSEDAAPGAARQVLLRRRLEACLAPGVQRVDDAAAALGELEARARAGEFSLEGAEDELLLRRLQVAALSGDVARAMSLLEECARLKDPHWARAGRRAILRSAVAAVDDPAPSARRAALLGAAFDCARQILDEPGASLDDAAMASVAIQAAGAAAALAESGDTSRARAGLDIVRALLTRSSREPRALRAAITLALAQGDRAAAVEWATTLANGEKVGTPGWCEARFRLATLLAEIDVARALAVIDQYRQLVSDWGPAPWAERMQQLDRTLRARGGGA